jgi:hypothetical protein
MSNVNNRLTGENMSNLVALLKRNRVHSLSHCLPLHSLEKGNKYKLSSILTLLPRPGANPMLLHSAQQQNSWRYQKIFL